MHCREHTQPVHAQLQATHTAQSSQAALRWDLRGQKTPASCSYSAHRAKPCSGKQDLLQRPPTAKEEPPTLPPGCPLALNQGEAPSSTAGLGTEPRISIPAPKLTNLPPKAAPGTKAHLFPTHEPIPGCRPDTSSLLCPPDSGNRQGSGLNGPFLGCCWGLHTRSQMAGNCQGPEPCQAASTGTVCPSPLTAARAFFGPLLSQSPSHRRGRAPLSPSWPQSPATAFQCHRHSCGLLSRGDKRDVFVQNPCLSMHFQIVPSCTGTETTLRQEEGKWDFKLLSSPLHSHDGICFQSLLPVQEGRGVGGLGEVSC